MFEASQQRQSPFAHTQGQPILTPFQAIEPTGVKHAVRPRSPFGWNPSRTGYRRPIAP
jgi:hypothetical protein